MLVDTESLYLYNLTLRAPSSYHQSILGQFLGEKKSQELVQVSSTHLQVIRPDVSTGKLEVISQQSLLGVIQSVEKIRILGTQRDLLVATGDSGKLVVLEYSNSLKRFVPIIQEPFAKNGYGRLNQGEYISVDPQNRAVCLSAIEKNKLIYKVQSTESGSIELSSPLESNHKNLLTIQITALDTEFDNPMFAAIEYDYNEPSGQDPTQAPLLLNYYELDQGLNHVVKKKSKDSIPSSSSHLIPLPGRIRGVLVCCDSYLIYDDPNPNRPRLYLPLPLRKGSSGTKIMNHVVHKLKKNNFFILLQSSLGDLFKLTVDYDEDKERIVNIVVNFFDTIPVSTNISILKSGFLFANVSNNDKLFYQFEKLGDDEETESKLKSSGFADMAAIDAWKLNPTTFEPKGLENLALVDVFESLSPISDAALVETHLQQSSDPLKQIVTLSSHSYLKSLVHGVPTTTIVESPLPISPTHIHTTKLTSESPNDAYLILSSTLDSRTLVLSIGEVVEEIEDSQFITDQPTVAVQQVGRTSVVQIYANGIRHVKHIIKDDEIVSKATTDWFPPAGIQILSASTNPHQVVIGLSNSEVCYFEVDLSDDQLIEYQDRIEMPSTISSIAISNTRSSFAVIGCTDETIQVVSLQSHRCLEVLSLQVLSANCVSLVMLTSDKSTYVHIGMENGLYVRTTVDEITGTLSDTRMKYLGTKPVQLSLVGLSDEENAILAISSRPWISYYNLGNFKMTPLLNINISSGSSFVSEDIGGKGIVGLSENNLVIFTLGEEDVGFDKNKDFNIDKIKLRYTPKKLVVDIDDHSQYIYVIESEYGIKGPFLQYPFSGKKEKKVSEKESEKHSEKHSIDIKQEQAELEIDQDYFDAFGYQKVPNSWASCIQVIDYTSQEVAQTLELPNQECAISMTKLTFESSKDNYLVVGVTTNQRFLPNSYESNHLYTFKINKKGPRLEFLHKTDLDAQPSALLAFNGKLLIGMGNYLRLYDLGQKQLLRKSSSKIDCLNVIVKLVHQGGDRVVVGDLKQSTTFVRYDSAENTFVAFANDVMKRHVTALTTLDYDTVVGGDKFGNIFVTRISQHISKQADEDWTLLKNQEPYLNAAPTRAHTVCEFYVQDIPTSFTKGSLVVGGQESIFYSGLQGTFGQLLPLSTKQEVEFLVNLELTMRKFFDYNFDDFDKDKNGYNLLGKDHLKFRGYYNPVKNVIDGDLVEKYYELNQATKIKIASQIDRTPKEIEKKISELRNRSAF